MITAFVHIACTPEKLEELAEAISQINGVTEVYSVTGDYDLLAIVRVAAIDELPGIVTNTMLKKPGILRANTSVGFKVYSRHDLEAMFSIGME